MRFTVVYTPEARDLLAELWLAAEDREAVKRAADEIDLALAATHWRSVSRAS